MNCKCDKSNNNIKPNKLLIILITFRENKSNSLSSCYLLVAFVSQRVFIANIVKNYGKGD